MRSPDTILTAAEMRAAEAEAIRGGTSAATLMERAGKAAAEAIWRFAGPLPALILCGPGNNGGDGYVIARELKARGVDVRVAALDAPQRAEAVAAREAWDGPVEPLDAAAPAPLLIDALFGTGLSRPLDDMPANALMRLAQAARARVAVDLPSGVATDDGAILSPVPDFDLTVTFGALKPSHLLQPAARHMGRVAVADIGLIAESDLHRIARPQLRAPGPDDHKYTRGYIALLAGEMPGAAALCATAAVRSGAGYVRLIADTTVANVPRAVVQSPEYNDGAAEIIADPRIGALAVGPGLGRSERARAILRRAIAAGRPLILDADALTLIAADFGMLAGLDETAILTPHEGEFARLFGTIGGSKVERVRAAAARADAVVLLKGPDTVVAAPDGRAAISPAAPSWLASAGTGDALTGIVAAMRAGGMAPFEAACAAIWLHKRAAELAGPFLIADDLVAHLPAALTECL